MRANGVAGSVAALRRKLRAIGLLAEDAGATASERENAEAAKQRLEQRLREAGAPKGDWTDKAFRLGRWAREIRKSAAPAPTDAGDWTDHARRLGKMVRRGCGLVQLTSDKRRSAAHSFYGALGFEATHQGYKLSL